MLQRLSETFIAGVELLEAEGRAARREVSRTATSLLAQAAAGVVVLIGLSLIIAGLVWLLAGPLGWPASLLIVGAACAAAGGIAAWSIQRGRSQRDRHTSALARSDRSKGSSHANGQPTPSTHKPHASTRGY